MQHEPTCSLCCSTIADSSCTLPTNFDRRTPFGTLVNAVLSTVHMASAVCRDRSNDTVQVKRTQPLQQLSFVQASMVRRCGAAHVVAAVTAAAAAAAGCHGAGWGLPRATPVHLAAPVLT